MAEAKVSVRSDLLKIAEDLGIITRTAEQTGRALGEATKQTAKTVNDQVAVVSGGMNKMRKLGGEVARQLKDDFKALFAVNAVIGGLKLSEQLAGTVKQAVQLNDVVRNLAPVFGMNEHAAEKFKRSLVKGLGEIGLGSDAAAAALQGLAETNVRGAENLQEYAKTASQLASISKQGGQEGTIAKGLAGVVVAQGGNPNDPRAMQRVAEDIVRIRNATGKSATEALDTLSKLFSSANTDFKKRLMQGGGVSLAAAGLIGGQGSTAFLERYLGLDKPRRAGLEAQGLGQLIGANGNLNAGAFQSTVAEAKRRGGGNAEFGLTTMGMSDEEAKGFLRLSQAMQENANSIEAARTATVDINEAFRSTLGLGESFRANLNKVKGSLTGVMEAIGAPDLVNKLTGGLDEASKSTVGAGAVVGGSALLAAMLTGKGLGAIGGLLSGEAKKTAVEAVTGEKVQRVEVINWPLSMTGAYQMFNPKIPGTEGFAGGAAKAAGGIGAIGGGTMAAAAVGVGLAGGQLAKYIGTGGLEDDLKSIFEKVFGSKSKSQGNIPVPAMSKDVRVTVESKDSSLKAYERGSRGTSQ